MMCGYLGRFQKVVRAENPSALPFVCDYEDWKRKPGLLARQCIYFGTLSILRIFRL